MSSPSHLPSDLGSLRNLITQLMDDLAVQRTVYESLKEMSGVEEQMEEAKDEINSIQRRLAQARKARDQAEKAAKPKSAAPSSQHRQNQAESRELAGGSRSTSSGSTSSNMPDSRPSTPSRKRTLSHANVTPGRSGHSKSRRGYPPHPTAGFDSSPPTGMNGAREDFLVIDLTGDDDELYKRLDEREQLIRRNKMIADGDAAVARRLQDEGVAIVGSSSAGASRSSQPAQSTPTWFDRIHPNHPQRSSQTPVPQPSQLARGSRAPQPQGVNSWDIAQRPSPRAGSGNNTFMAPAVPDPRFAVPQMPGAYVDSDGEEDQVGGLLGVPTGTGVPSSWRAPMSLSNAHAANEAARQAALARTRGFGAGLPADNVDSWQTQLGSQWPADWPANSAFLGTAPQRPGYIHGGVGNPLHTQSNRFTTGRNVYEGQLYAGPGAGLSSVIQRTAGYDYDNMVDAAGNPLNERVTNYIHDIMEDPRKTNEEIQNLLSNIRPDMEIPAEERGETPEALKYPLYTHQQVALKWMSDMEQGSNKGGILADDMGLGKTISTLSLIVTRQSTTSVKTNLIVGPVALIKQWEVEIRKKLKSEHRLSVVLYHQKRLQYSDMKTYDVVLTTYGKVSSELKRYENHLKARQDSTHYQPNEDAQLQRLCPLIHPKSKFYRVILDEAQCIKNRISQSSLGCNQLSAEYRWCLTGTPMMNGVNELYPLIRFLKIRPYNELKRFTSQFGSLTAKKYTTETVKAEAMSKLRIILKAIMLRRMKDSKIDGKPILQLPPKVETVQNCVFSEDEQKFYEELETKSQVTFNKYLRAGTVGKNYSNILVLLLRLRQACCHPHLNMDVEYAAVTDVSVETMQDFAKALSEAVVNRLKAADGFECPICFDPVLDPTMFFPCGHDTCAECFTSLNENALQEHVRSGQQGEATAPCPQCRAPVEAKKVFTYNVFKQVHMPETIEGAPASGKADDEEDDDDDDSDSDSDSDDDTASEASDDDMDDNGDLRDFIVPDDEVETASEADEDENEDEEFPDVVGAAMPSSAAQKTRQAKKKRSKRGKKGKKGKGKAKADDVKPHMLKTLRLESSKNKEARRKYMRYLKKNWEPSAKTTKVCEILKDIEPTSEKTIIFSQWTALLDLLEIPIKHELGIKYARYDGGMSRTQREQAIQEFVENPRVKVLLVSLRAGNAGLNLTVASHVIICDPFWNPFIEMQAVDRAHRIGQQLPVQVHRVLVKGNAADGGTGAKGDADGPMNNLAETVEDRIVKLQEQKRGLINAALDEGESRSLGRLSTRELQYLFGVSRVR